MDVPGPESLQVSGKLEGRAAAAVSAQPGRPGRLGFLLDEKAAESFLVDTGSVFSVLPYVSSTPAQGPAITSADGSPIACWGWVDREVQFSGRHFTWRFLQAAVAFPLLGADFLRFFKLSVDLSAGTVHSDRFKLCLAATPEGRLLASAGVQLADSTKITSTTSALQQRLPDIGSTTSALQEKGVAAGGTQGGSEVYKRILESFPKVLNAAKTLPPVKHTVQHHIETSGRPVSAKYRRLDATRLEAAKVEFAELERQGVVRRSSSDWASPLHMVRKSDGGWRPCGDFRNLNLQTQPDRYTCPNIGDLTARLEGCKVFTKLDLRKGYHQVPVKPSDIKKTAIVTPFGLYEFVRMPFGLRNAGQTFQRMMDSILAGLEYCFVYLDDVLIASSTHEQHQEDLREVLARFEKHGLVLNGGKCVLGVSEVDYLGHRITATGIRPIASKVEAIDVFPQPETARQLQTYLGMVNFYRRFLPGAANVLRPLTEVLKGGKTGKLLWTVEMQKAFQDSKRGIVNAVELAHPNQKAILSLAVDASMTHVGAVLQQRVGGGQLRPLAFYSHKLEPAQTKYSAFDRELLAVYLAIKHFRWMLEGRAFYVLTDHKPLTYALHRLTDAVSARQQRHLSFIAEYTSDVRHIAGRDNVVADALSRPAAAVAAPASSTVDFASLARAQRESNEVQELGLGSTLQLQDVEIQGQVLTCDVSTGVLRPVVPSQQKKVVFDAIHGLAHPGIRASRRMVSTRFVWKGMAGDITQWCRNCTGCATGKVTVQEETPVQQIPLPAQRFQHVHVDLVGPWPASEAGHTYVMTCVDRSTRWPEVLPLTDIRAETCADTFVSGWVARFGVPHSVTTDRGTQFTSAIWACLCAKLGMKHITTTAYHPQSNGMVERFHLQLKQSLRARGCGPAWLAHLPWVLLGLRAAPKEESGISSAEAVYGAPMALPGQAQTVEKIGTQGQTPGGQKAIPLRTRPSNRGRPSILEEVTHVYVRRGPLGGPLDQSYAGPYEVLDRSRKVYRLQVGGHVESVSADRLKPHLGDPPEVAVPPRRGRPPGSGGGG